MFPKNILRWLRVIPSNGFKSSKDNPQKNRLSKKIIISLQDHITQIMLHGLGLCSPFFKFFKKKTGAGRLAKIAIKSEKKIERVGEPTANNLIPTAGKDICEANKGVSLRSKQGGKFAKQTIETPFYCIKQVLLDECLQLEHPLLEYWIMGIDPYPIKQTKSAFIFKR